VHPGRVSVTMSPVSRQFRHNPVENADTSALQFQPSLHLQLLEQAADDFAGLVMKAAGTSRIDSGGLRRPCFLHAFMWPIYACGTPATLALCCRHGMCARKANPCSKAASWQEQPEKGDRRNPGGFRVRTTPVRAICYFAGYSVQQACRLSVLSPAGPATRRRITCGTSRYASRIASTCASW